MKNRINQAKAGYRKNTGHKIFDYQIADLLWPGSKSDHSKKITFSAMKKGNRKIQYNEMVQLASFLHCTPAFLNGSEVYSFIK